MSHPDQSFSRRRSCLSTFSLVMAWCCALQSTAWAIGPYVRIEQDWELQVGAPDPGQPSPQISIVLEPYPGSTKGGVLLLNYQDTPSFGAGGYQLQLWDGDKAVALLARDSGGTLGVNGEKITFTLFMELNKGKLDFGISRASFGTWNNVPKGGLTISMPYTELASFDGYYATSDTVSESGLILGTTTEVKVLRIVAVRKYDAHGKSDNEPKVQVFP